MRVAAKLDRKLSETAIFNVTINWTIFLYEGNLTNDTIFPLLDRECPVNKYSPRSPHFESVLAYKTLGAQLSSRLTLHIVTTAVDYF